MASSVSKSVAKVKSFDGASKSNGRAQKEIGNPYSKLVKRKVSVKKTPWCRMLCAVADYVTKTVKKFTTTAGCRQAWNWYKKNKHAYKKGATPKLGDEAFFDFKRKKASKPTHVGRVISINTKKHTCVTEEGNVSNKTKRRCFNYKTYRYLIGFGRPFFK